ncbi:hypothetical protein CLPUN_35700 [Clostridium puniceum]|uniref:Uncharacterized protein n=1 Tax=Clostridium puniceum TaxID=29367 RepID=A0A1S8TBF5_9CLOT|nr:hypothetical protein CLPUN_35700 [Clostridium puniceum]
MIKNELVTIFRLISKNKNKKVMYYGLNFKGR